MIKNKKKLLLLISIIAIILVSSFSYAWFIYSDVQDDSNIGSTACFKLEFEEENTIELRNAIPVEDSEGLTYVPYTFTITNVCDSASSFYVTLEELEESNMDLNGIRYQFNNDEPQTLGNIVTNNDVVLDNAKSSRTFDSGILLKDEYKSYSLRLWVDINSTAEQTAEKVFKSKVVVISNWNKDPYWNLTLADNLNQTNENVQVVKGRKISELPTLSKTNYDFLGWYDSNDNKITENSIINGDTTIYAKWLHLKWTITYNLNGGTSSSRSSEEIYRGDKIASMPTASKSSTAQYSYSLSGWYTSASGGTKITSNSEINSDMTLYAHWSSTVREYTLTVNNGTGGGRYSYNTPVQISATIPSQVVGNWSKDGASTIGDTRSRSVTTYTWNKWSDGNTSQTRTVYVTGDATYTASINSSTASQTQKYKIYNVDYIMCGNSRSFGISGGSYSMQYQSACGDTWAQDVSTGLSSGTTFYINVSNVRLLNGLGGCNGAEESKVSCTLRAGSILKTLNGTYSGGNSSNLTGMSCTLAYCSWQ